MSTDIVFPALPQRIECTVERFVYYLAIVVQQILADLFITSSPIATIGIISNQGTKAPFLLHFVIRKLLENFVHFFLGFILILSDL